MSVDLNPDPTIERKRSYSYGGDVYDYAFMAMVAAYNLYSANAADLIGEIEDRNEQIRYYRALKQAIRNELNELATGSGSSTPVSSDGSGTSATNYADREPTREELNNMEDGVWYYYREEGVLYRIAKGHTNHTSENATNATRFHIKQAQKEDGTWDEENTWVREGRRDENIWVNLGSDYVAQAHWNTVDHGRQRRLTWDPEADSLFVEKAAQPGQVEDHQVTGWVDGSQTPVEYRDTDGTFSEDGEGYTGGYDNTDEGPYADMYDGWSKEALEAELETLEEKISSLSSFNQIDLIKLQKIINDMNLVITLLSNLLKAEKDTKEGIVRNI